MKAITLWQPWASLPACGVIQYETRSWATKYRGPMAIHAAAGEPKNLFHQMSGIVTSILGEDIQPEYPRGVVIATADLIACHEMEEDKSGNIGFWHSKHGIREFYAISEQQASLGDSTATPFPLSHRIKRTTSNVFLPMRETLWTRTMSIMPFSASVQNSLNTGALHLAAFCLLEKFRAKSSGQNTSSYKDNM